MSQKITKQPNTQPIPQDSVEEQPVATPDNLETEETVVEDSVKEIPVPGGSSKARAAAKAAKASNGYPADWQDKVIVEQWEEFILDGAKYEKTGTRTTQTYEPMFYDRMLKENFFAESSWGHVVKHDPRKQ